MRQLGCYPDVRNGLVDFEVEAQANCIPMEAGDVFEQIDEAAERLVE